MLISIAATLAAVQPSGVPPTPVALQIVSEGSATDRAGLNRLLFQVWSPRGDMRAVAQRGAERHSPCVTLGAVVEVDTACVQRRLPKRRDGLPVVALVVTPSNNGPYRHRLHCVGASGAGQEHVASLAAIAEPGLLSRQKNNDRVAVARCINQAAPRSVTGSLW